MSQVLFRTSMALITLIGFISFPASAKISVEQMAVIGDAGKSGRALDQLKASLLREQVFSIVMPGDNLYSGSYSSVWDSWKNKDFMFDIVAIGNHNGGYKAEMQYFGMPAEYYSIVKAGARFIVLNSDNKANVTQQIDWLKNELEKASEKLIFLVYHHPTYTVSQSHTWGEKKEFQVAMRNVFKIYGSKITALLLGHDHMSSFLTFGDIPAVVAGAGREVRNETAVSYNEGGVRVQARYLAPRNAHWALLEIDENSETASIHFVRVHDQHRSCTANFGNQAMRLELEDNCN